MPFIVLEGLDGAGKSTQIAKLKEMMIGRGLECEYVHFPRFDSPVFGELIARFLRGELGDLSSVNPYLVALIFAGDRADAASMIKGWLGQGKFVIVDRYVYSNIGYQCAKLPVEERDALRRWIMELEFGYYNLPVPDVSIFLNVPFEFTERKLSQIRDGDDRSYLNGASDIHESSLDLQRTVRQVYLDAANDDSKLMIIDCSEPNGIMSDPDTIFSKIISTVDQTLK